MDLDSVLCARSIGLEYILRNHLKVEKETKVSLQNAILNVVTITDILNPFGNRCTPPTIIFPFQYYLYTSDTATF